MDFKVWRWPALFKLIDTAKTVNEWNQTLLYMLPFYLAMSFILIIVLIILPMILEKNSFAIAICTAIVTFILMYALWIPTSYAFIFKLRAVNRLSGIFLAVIIYFPVFTLAIFAYMTLMWTIFSDVDNSVSQLGEWAPFPIMIGLTGSVLTTWIYHIGKAAAPAPAITRRLSYLYIEAVVSLGSLMCVGYIILSFVI